MMLPESSMMKDYELELLTPPIQALIEQIIRFFDRFGFRRNLGRIWSVIYLAPKPLSQAEIASLTGLSSGLVSVSLKELEHWSAIQIVSIRGMRSRQYQAEEKLLRTVASILVKRELEAVRDLRESAAELRKSFARGSTHRLEGRLQSIEQIAALYETLSGLIGKISSLPTSAIARIIKIIKIARFLN